MRRKELGELEIARDVDGSVLYHSLLGAGKRRECLARLSQLAGLWPVWITTSQKPTSGAFSLHHCTANRVIVRCASVATLFPSPPVIY